MKTTPKHAHVRSHAKALAAAAALVALCGPAQAAFEGRNAANQIDLGCTVSGASKCTSFYDSTLDITILNNWNIGQGPWSATGAAGSAQAIAASAGLAATGLLGWVLPTGDSFRSAGPANQYQSIWEEVGQSLAGLQGQFDGVLQSVDYWSGSVAPDYEAWGFDPGSGFQGSVFTTERLYAVAVRPGDVAVVPAPQTMQLALTGLGLLAAMRRRRLR